MEILVNIRTSRADLLYLQSQGHVVLEVVDVQYVCRRARGDSSCILVDADRLPERRQLVPLDVVMVRLSDS